MQFELKIIAENLGELNDIVDRLQAPRVQGASGGTPPALAPVEMHGAAPAVFVSPEPTFAAPAFTPNVPPAPVATAPVSAPVAPAPSAVSPTPAGAGEVLDSRGFPWDGRIHAGSKAFLAKTGAWKPLKMVDKALVAQVEAEYRAKGYGNGTVAPTEQEDDETPAAFTAPAAPALPAPTPVVPAVPAVPAPALPPSIPAATNPAAAVMQRALKVIGEKTVDGAWIKNFLNAIGVSDLSALQGNVAAAETLDRALNNLPLFTRINNLVAGGKLTQEWVAQLLASLSLADTNALLVDDEKVQYVGDFLTQNGL